MFQTLTKLVQRGSVYGKRRLSLVANPVRGVPHVCACTPGMLVRRVFSSESSQEPAIREFDEQNVKPATPLISGIHTFLKANISKSDDMMEAQTEIQDPAVVFDTIWNNLKARYGEENLVFPKDIMWLAGAPGAGKGRVTPFISKLKGITVPPIEMSSLLDSPEMKKIKESGALVNDRQVVEALFTALLDSKYQQGCIVDGFPRTKVQAECIKLLYDHMRTLRRRFEGTKHFGKFRRPIFHITVLFVEEQESIKRQLGRGKQIEKLNDAVKATGVGNIQELRKTDVDPLLAAERYRQFRDQVYDSLTAVKEKFHFHFINAEGSVEEVQQRIAQELEYQSSMELGDETFEQVRIIPLASEVIKNARYELVKRLDQYMATNPELFQEVIAVLNKEFIRIIHRQALSGRAIIRSENAVFEKSAAVDMALDLFSERGFTVCLDKQRRNHPVSVDLGSGLIKHETRKVYEFQIQWERPTIRRG